jgi:hypothetical protein
MDQIAALRAEWLAQLAEAIEGAQQLAWQLGTQEVTSIEARELYGRLEVARIELDSLRQLHGGRSCAIEPDWLQKLGFAPFPEADA